MELRDLNSENLVQESEPKQRCSSSSNGDNNGIKTLSNVELNNQQIIYFIEARKAAMFGEVDRLRKLLDCRHVQADAADSDDCTLLHWAAINNRIEVYFF